MAAALWQSIDMTASDGGLASCFKAARVVPSLIENLTSVQKFETLRDFAESYSDVDTSQSYYELLLDKIWQADTATKEVRVERHVQEDPVPKPPPEPADDDGWDSEYEELLEELCVQDNTNAQ